MTRVLVIEDEPAILRGLADNLKFESYDVLTAGDGEAGFELLRTGRPDLVILDLMLPKMSGYDVCRKARAGGIRTPILMLTARGEEMDRVAGLDLGADDYLTKPFSLPSFWPASALCSGAPKPSLPSRIPCCSTMSPSISPNTKRGAPAPYSI
jgi:Response regulators consisting of a CheY-like receiver domain and a winged-helix DNA-binding domain